MAPPQCVSAYPVVERHFVGLSLHAASTKHTNLASVVSIGYCGSFCLLFGISSMADVGNSSSTPFLWKMIPHSLVICKYFVMLLRQW